MRLRKGKVPLREGILNKGPVIARCSHYKGVRLTFSSDSNLKKGK